MTTSNNTQTLAQAMQARYQKHSEATNLLSQIEAAQNAIEENQNQINKLNIAASYYKTLSAVHLAQIEKQTAIRNEAINLYQKLMWQIYSAGLPVFSSTGIQEISVTLYSAHTVTVQA